MIYILTGEDTVSSRNKLVELLSNKTSIVRLDGKKCLIAELDEALASGSLFSDSKTVVVENFTKLKPEAKVWDLLEKFEKDKNTDAILWDEAKIDKKTFPKAKVFDFTFPKFYYAFLDGFNPASNANTRMLAEVLKTLAPEQILYGLTKRVRQLLMVKSENKKDFVEFRRMQPWQVGKLKKQASFWSDDQLKKVFMELADLDEKIKTGGLPLPLSKHLDILLLSDLN